MKAVAFVALIAPFGVACGGSGGAAGPDAGADGTGTGSDSGSGTPHVTVVTGVAPALIAFREEASAAWTTPTSTSTGTYELPVTGPYRVVVVCGGSTRSTFVAEYARTLDDERRIDHACSAAQDFPFHVTGQMLQEGEVFFGATGRGQSMAPWTFDLRAKAGTFDFVAFFGSLGSRFDQIEIRRDIAITGDLALGTIDVAQEHTQALVSTTFTASNPDPAEFLSSDLMLQSGNTFAVTSLFDQLAWQVGLVPDAALRATDTQDLQLSAQTSDASMQTHFRALLRRVHDGGSTAVVLPDPMGQTAFATTADRLTATWTALPAHDEIDLWRQSFTSDFSSFIFHDLLFSRAFLVATGATSATLDLSDVPGFRAEWRHDPTLEQFVGLDAFRTASSGDGLLSDVSQDVPAPSPAPPGAAPRDRRHAMALVQQQRAQLRQRKVHPSAR
jgi:hypothetical protein